MNVSLMISRRLRLAGSGRGPSRSGLVIAVSGIALALAVMMISMAVVVGFKNAISAKLSGFEADITLIPLPMTDARGNIVAPVEPSVDEVMDISRTLLAPYAADTLRVAQVLDRPGILKTDTDFLGVIFRAFGPEHSYGFEEANLLEGNLPHAPGEIAVSSLQANRLGLKTGDKVFTHFITGNTVRTRRFLISGIYASNFGEYDQTLAYAQSADISSVPGVGNDCFEIRGLRPEFIDSAAEMLQKQLDTAFTHDEIHEPYVAQSIHRRGATFFNWLSMLDTNVVVILVLMACVSGFTLISSLIILILERVRLIGVLKSLGALNRQVRGVFLWLGLRIIILGLLIGNATALLLIFAQRTWHFIPLDPQAYYLSYVPVEISLSQVLILNAAVILGGVLLMLVPASIISRISPVSVIRYE